MPCPQCIAQFSHSRSASGLLGSPSSRSSVCARTYKLGRPVTACSSFSAAVITATPTNPATSPRAAAPAVIVPLLLRCPSGQVIKGVPLRAPSAGEAAASRHSRRRGRRAHRRPAGPARCARSSADCRYVRVGALLRTSRGSGRAGLGCCTPPLPGPAACLGPEGISRALRQRTTAQHGGLDRDFAGARPDGACRTSPGLEPAAGRAPNDTPRHAAGVRATRTP